MPTRARVLCFPFAGGGAIAFRSWRAHLPAGVELCAFEPPGRGARLGEPALDTWDAMRREIERYVAPRVGEPFVLYGHSLGAAMAFEAVRLLRRRGLPSPRHLFVGAAHAPGRPLRRPTRPDMPRDELLDELRKLGGTPREILENEELMDLFLPTIRADFLLSATHTFGDEPPLDVPLTAFAGVRDTEVTLDEVRAWLQLTTGPSTLETFDEEHFFVEQRSAAIVGQVRRVLGV